MPARRTARRVVIRAYTSPTLVFLAFDWPDGGAHPDFLGFSVRRDPGFTPSRRPQFLLNRLGFEPLPKGARWPTSDKAPIQKFNWWDPAIKPADSGTSFAYTVTPILGTGPTDLRPVSSAAATLRVRIPKTTVGGIGTYFNRAVVSSQAFSRIKKRPLTQQMSWLANGIERAVPDFLDAIDRYDCGIYHLTDAWKIVPAMKRFSGDADVVYFFKPPSAKGKGGDDTDVNARDALQSAHRSFHQRSRIRGLMHDKYIVGFSNGHPVGVLMGSMNFTPEAATVQANVVHTFASSEMAKLYADRHALLVPDPTTPQTAQHSGWHGVTDLPGTKLRVFFSPEPSGERVSVDTVVDAVMKARSSVMFCMFSPTDPPLLKAMLDAADEGKIVYGLRNSIPDPTKTTGAAKDTEAHRVAVDVWNRSRRDHKTVSYDFFRPGTEPMDFLPELSTIDTHAFSLAPAGKAPAVHIHHKFVLIDADTDHPTIYTGSANMSDNSTHNNDENLLEIRDNVPLARTYLAEFMRLYNHYHARAVWEQSHGKGSKHRVRRGSARDPLVLKRTRDAWIKGAYTQGTAEHAARTRLAGG